MSAVKVVMVDNYDSFTYNLVQYLGELGADVTVVRNDQVTVADIEKLAPDKIVISPGPCTPKEAGVSVETILKFAGHTPLLGVCLGHQSIGYAFGGNIIHAKSIMHGKWRGLCSWFRPIHFWARNRKRYRHRLVYVTCCL